MPCKCSQRSGGTIATSFNFVPTSLHTPTPNRKRTTTTILPTYSDIVWGRGGAIVIMDKPKHHKKRRKGGGNAANPNPNLTDLYYKLHPQTREKIQGVAKEGLKHAGKELAKKAAIGAAAIGVPLAAKQVYKKIRRKK